VKWFLVRRASLGSSAMKSGLRIDQLRKALTAERMAQLLSIPIFLGIWEIVSSANLVNPMLFPPPSVVFPSFLDWVWSGLFWVDLQNSLRRVTVGFLLGSLFGVIIGITTGRFRILSGLVSPIFGLLRPIPPIAFVPLVILWFGLSETGKYFLVFWGVFFTVWISAHLGVQKVNPAYLRAAYCLGTPEYKMLFHILLPGALPYILVGVRTALGVAFYTLVAAEIAGTFSGVFYRIDISQQNMQIGVAMSGLFVLGILALIADKVFAIISKRLTWNE
jgi:ABC-type nitrate/sulfonate/bicarbonate transport system permease component